jgi:PAS domain S-box-containing protein
MAADLEAHGREIGRTMAALRESEERFRQFADNSHDVLWMCDGRSRRLDFVSRAFEEIWGQAPEGVASGRVPFQDTVHPDDRPAVAHALPDALAGKEVAVTYRVLRPDGTIRWVRDSGFPIRDATGQVIRVGGICRDVTAWKAIEIERERALREREVMLREINHRVKNNLQVIVSLLRLQASRSAKPEVREAFDQACGRVSTITELHAALFDGAQIGTIDFGRYLHELCARLESGTRGSHGADVGIQVDAVSGTIDLDRAVPLGLIVNELVTNAVKHGLVGDGALTVRVSFERQDGRYRLSVRDDGRGVAGGIGALKEGLGMQLVHGFVRRIRGSLTIVAEPGFEAVIAFPVEHHPGKAAGRG